MNSTTISRLGFRAFKAVIIYAVVWSVVFGFCYLINKAVNETATQSVLQAVKYAGYPLLAIAWALGWIFAGIVFVVGKILLGAVWVLKTTYPFNLYFPGIPLAMWVIYKIAIHVMAQPGPTQAEREAEARHAETMRAVRGAMLYRSLSDMTKK